MRDLSEGQSVEVQGSARLPYVLKNVGWRLFVFVSSLAKSVAADRTPDLQAPAAIAGRASRSGSASAGQYLPPNKQPPRTKDRSRLLLAETWNATTDVAGWWLSEKLDGVRALWDGQQFLSRQGNVFHAPAWFTASLPSVPLDGELWLARKAFQRTVSIVRRHDQSARWQRSPLPGVRCPGRRRAVRSADRVSARLVCRPPAALCASWSHTSGAAAQRIWMQNWRASRRWAAKD